MGLTCVQIDLDSSAWLAFPSHIQYPCKLNLHWLCDLTSMHTHAHTHTHTHTHTVNNLAIELVHISAETNAVVVTRHDSYLPYLGGPQYRGSPFRRDTGLDRSPAPGGRRVCVMGPFPQRGPGKGPVPRPAGSHQSREGTMET